MILTCHTLTEVLVTSNMGFFLLSNLKLLHMPVLLAKIITAVVVFAVIFIVYTYMEYLRDYKIPPVNLLRLILVCLLFSMLIAAYGFIHLWFYHWYPIDIAPWNIK